MEIRSHPPDACPAPDVAAADFSSGMGMPPAAAWCQADPERCARVKANAEEWRKRCADDPATGETQKAKLRNLMERRPAPPERVAVQRGHGRAGRI